MKKLIIILTLSITFFFCFGFQPTYKTDYYYGSLTLFWSPGSNLPFYGDAECLSNLFIAQSRKIFTYVNKF